jgi:histidinol-phosphatase (PHP family)
MAEMCRAAIEKGIPEIGFCDHFDLVPEDPCYAFFNADAWWRDLEACRNDFSNRLTIRAGVEIGEPHRFPREVADLLANYDWDFTMGSLHWVGNALVFRPDYFRRSKHDAYADYFRELHELVQMDAINILAHSDIVKRYGYEHYGPYRPEAHETELRTLLRSCAERDIALEINTSTLRRPIAETSPTGIVVSWFREEGGKWVTLGSDAHVPEDVGSGLEKAMKEARRAGFETVASFERLKPRSMPMPNAAGGK